MRTTADDRIAPFRFCGASVSGQQGRGRGGRPNLYVLLAILSILDSIAAAPMKEVRRVVIFNEIGIWSSGVATINNEIFAALERSPYQNEFYCKSLDTSLFPDGVSQGQLRDSCFRKYRNRKLDLIIAVGPRPM